MSYKILFLDIDGPMLPFRLHSLEENKVVRETFDPCAVDLLKSVIVISGAKIVVSSSWAEKGFDFISRIFKKNDIPLSFMHPDWMTPRPLGQCNPDRKIEILGWLKKHPEVTHYVAVDDMNIPDINLVRVSFIEGLKIEHKDRMLYFFKDKGKS